MPDHCNKEQTFTLIGITEEWEWHRETRQTINPMLDKRLLKPLKQSTVTELFHIYVCLQANIHALVTFTLKILAYVSFLINRKEI